MGTLSCLGPSYYTCAFYRSCPFNHGVCLNKKKIWAKTKTIQVQLLLYQSAHVCVGVYYDSLCQILLRDLKTYPWCILYRQLLSILSLIMLCLSKNLIPLLYINFTKILKTMGELKS